MPTSTWSLGSKAKVPGVPQRRTPRCPIRHAYRDRPRGQVGHGRQHGQQLGLDLLQARGGLLQLDLLAATWVLDGFGASSLSPRLISMPTQLDSWLRWAWQFFAGSAAFCARIPVARNTETSRKSAFLRFSGARWRCSRSLRRRRMSSMKGILVSSRRCLLPRGIRLQRGGACTPLRGGTDAGQRPLQAPYANSAEATGIEIGAAENEAMALRPKLVGAGLQRPPGSARRRFHGQFPVLSTANCAAPRMASAGQQQPHRAHGVG